MIGSTLGMLHSASHGRGCGGTPPKCSFCVPAPPVWNEAWGRCVTWRPSQAGGLCLQSRPAGSTSVTTASSVDQDPGKLHTPACLVCNLHSPPCLICTLLHVFDQHPAKFVRSDV